MEYSSRAIDVDGIALAARGPRCGQVRVVYLADRLADVSADTGSGDGSLKRILRKALPEIIRSKDATTGERLEACRLLWKILASATKGKPRGGEKSEWRG